MSIGGTPSGLGPQESASDGQRQQGIAAAITEVSERATLLVREEIELAKAEIAEKTTRLAKGAVVAIVAGVFFFTALFFILIGFAWLLYYELPIGNVYTYFWGFFAMAVILVILGTLAGLLAAKAVRSGAPPTPDMAIEEARKIRETVSSPAPAGPDGAPAGTPASAGTQPSGTPASAGTQPSGTPASAGMQAGGAAQTPPIPPPAGGTGTSAPGADYDIGRGDTGGTTLDG